MQKYVAILSYRGTSFCGWQRQAGPADHGGPSIQGVIEDALHTMTQEKVSVVGSGRTDSDVHAIGQVAHFRLERKNWEPEILRRGLNSHLKSQIQVLRVQRVAEDFNAQRSATRKQYSYYFQQGTCALPHLEPYSWWISRKMDLQAMNRGLGYLKGEHDFLAFQASGGKVRSTVRTLFEAEVTLEPIPFPMMAPETPGFALIRVRLVGSGFLRQMIRGIAGTLLQIGEARRPPEDMKVTLDARSRSLVGATAPGRALWLERVWYPSRFGLSESFDNDMSGR